MTQLARLIQTEPLPDCPLIPKQATQSELLAMLRPWLATEKQHIKEIFMRSSDGAQLLRSHTAVIDALISALYHHFAGGRCVDMAVVAVGGYGRSKLFPYSDIDLLFLHEGASHAADVIAESMLYALWDLGLSIGQSHLNTQEAIESAKRDMTIRSNLLDARFVAGNASLFEGFVTRFEGDVIAGSEMEFVEAKLTERDARHKRFGDSRYMLEPNVKEGKGGLRDVHTLWWLVRYVYPIRELDDMVPMELLTAEEFAALDQARQFLYRVRCYLHYDADRAQERLSFDRQHALATAMGYCHPYANQAISRFMKRYFVAVRTVGATTRIFCALLEDKHKRRPRKALAALWHEPHKLGGFRLEGERLNLRAHQSFEYNPTLMLEMFYISQQHGIDIHPQVLQKMARSVKLIDDRLRRDPVANMTFLNILLSDKNPETTLRRMSEAGVLGKFVPDFGRVVGQTQFNMYHIYTVDEHTLVAIGILHALEQGLHKKTLPVASEVVGRITMRRALYLALFCHDIAKGRGGDHSEMGEKIVARFAARMGCTQEEIQMCAWLVRYHLLLSNTAFKRDVNDTNTIQDFVEKVQSLERLKLLFVLTVVDIRAVSPQVWNGWKASLLTELYKRAEELITTGKLESRQLQQSELKKRLSKQLSGWRTEAVHEYIENLSPDFLTAFDVERHKVLADMLTSLDEQKLLLRLDVRHDSRRAISEITVCTEDRPFVFSLISGAIALAGATIINAKIYTLKHGKAVDVFQVQDIVGQSFNEPERIARMSHYIEEALAGRLDLASAFARKRLDATRLTDPMPVPGQVFIENNTSSLYSVIELVGHDRPGLLYDITGTMGSLGLTIVTAHISTYGTQVADVFYVKDAFGFKLEHKEKRAQVRSALLAVMADPATISLAES